MDISTLDFVMFLLFVFSSPIYVIFMITLWKYRNKVPFNKPFFTITFNLGILDLIHIFSDWFLGKFAHFGWLGVHHIVMVYPSLFAKLNSLFWWYVGLAQTLGVVSMAANRMSVIGFRKTWTKQMVKIDLIVTWLFPIVMVAPQLTFDFGYYHVNKTGGVIAYWFDAEWQWRYFLVCGIWCLLVALVCATCYTITFIKVRKHRKSQTKANKSNDKLQRKAEINLVWVGFVLCIMQGLCSGFCCIMSFSTDPTTLKMMMTAQNIILDVYSWINPYVLLMSSEKVRSHFKAVLFCGKPQEIDIISHKVSNTKNQKTKKITVSDQPTK